MEAREGSNITTNEPSSCTSVVPSGQGLAQENNVHSDDALMYMN